MLSQIPFESVAQKVGDPKSSACKPLSSSEVIASANRIIIKVGTSVAMNSPHWWQIFIQEIVHISSAGKSVVLVVSGANQLARNSITSNGVELENSSTRQTAIGAHGQALLTARLVQFFKDQDHRVAQLLVRQADLCSEVNSRNLSGTIECLLSSGITPIINQDDAASNDNNDEWNNDHVAAWLCTIVDVDLVLFLTNVDGVFATPPPAENPGEPIPRLSINRAAEINTESSMVRKDGGSGGMFAKLFAAQSIAQLGIPCIITNGNQNRPLESLISGGANTLIIPHRKRSNRQEADRD